MNITGIAWTLGIAQLLFGAGLIFGAPRLRAVWLDFPRHRAAAVLLAAAAIAWAAVVLWQSPLGRFEPYRRWLPLLAAGVYVATVLLADDLLAPRALGGILLLAAAPVLDAIRWEPAAWRYLFTVQAYLWVVTGMILVFSPFRFRHAGEWIFAGSWRASIAGGLLVLLGGFSILLALTVFMPAPS